MLDIITSFKFARISDVVFSEDLSRDQFNNLDLKNIFVMENSDRVKYINQNFTIRNNDIIFCSTEHVKFLFKLLKNSNLQNLKLITSQSDIKITRRLSKKLPDCFNNWFCINSAVAHPKITPIPLGVSNNYDKNLSELDFIKTKLNFFEQKKYLLYVNFNINTNMKKRMYLYNFFKADKDILITNHNSNNDEYIKNLKLSNFTLCPEGNGIETHRFWEALYNSSIPIVESKILYKGLKDAPVMIIKDFKLITKEYLNKFIKNKTFNTEILEFNYWRKIIQDSNNTRRQDLKLDFKVSNFTMKKYIFSKKITHLFKKINKYVTYLYWKIKKNLLY